MDDNQAVRLCQEGEKNAFQHVVETYAGVLYGTAFLMTRDRAIAEDFVQDTLLLAWRGIARFRAGTNLKAWLVRILVNQVLSSRRRARPEEETREDPPLQQVQADEAAPILMHAETRERLRGALAGLALGYDMSARASEEGKINRVILMSDGVANVGNTDPITLLQQIKESSRTGITLSTIGVGLANYNDVLLEKLADHGDGNYAYIDTQQEADTLFGDGLTGLLEVIASDAKIQVEFDPAAVAMYRLVGYENRGLTAQQFRDDAVDAGEVGAGHSVTALYELMLTPEAAGRLGTVRVRYADPDTGEVHEIARPVTVDEIQVDFGHAPARLQFTASVAAFAEVLRKSPWAGDLPLETIKDLAEAALAKLEPTDRDRDFIETVGRAIELGVTGYVEAGE